MELKKTIGKIEVTALALGSIIGSGAFILPGELFLKKLGFYNAIIGIIMGALGILIIEKSYGYLINKFPLAGGEYIFVKNSLGKKNAFICGWFLLFAYISIIPLNATALSIIINTISPKILHWGYLYTVASYPVYFGEVMLAIFLLFCFAFFNIRNVKIAMIVQNILVFLLVGIILFFAFILISSEGFSNANLQSYLSFESLNIYGILKTMVIAPFLFIGFDCIPQISEELTFEPKKASLLAMLAVIIGAMLYIIIMFCTTFGIPKELLINGSINWATGYSIELYFGKIGLLFIVIAFITAVIAGINGFYFASSRLILAMARDGDLPSIFGKVDEKNNTPKNAIILILIISLIAPWLGRKSLLWMIDISSIGAMFGYLYTTISAIILYKKEYNKINYWSILGSCICFVFLFLMLTPGLSTSLSKESYMAFTIWLILGAVIYRKMKIFRMK